MNRYLLKDSDEGFYNVIIFNEDINVDELEKEIVKYKENNIGEWDIDGVTHHLKKYYGDKIKEILIFDYIIGNISDITNLGGN